MATFISKYSTTPVADSPRSSTESQFSNSLQSPEWNPPKSVLGTTIVELEDLGYDEREEMLNFLVENDIQFRREEDGMYAADIRIVEPRTRKNENGTKKGVRRARASTTASMQSSQYANGKLYRRASRPPEEMKRVVCAMDDAERMFDYSCYPRLCAIVSQHGILKPRRRTVGWVMRTIEDIYDARHALVTPEVGGDGYDPDAFRLSRIFPVFVVDKFAKQYGLRKLVDQTCWDLMYNVHGLRTSYQEIEIFARFVEEFYDPEELVFFLYARSILQRELKIKFRQEWVETCASTSSNKVVPKRSGREDTEAKLTLNMREARVIAKLIFGTNTNKLYKSFLAEVHEKCAGSKHINIMKFLHLALLRYHKLKPEADVQLNNETIDETKNTPVPDGISDQFSNQVNPANGIESNQPQTYSNSKQNEFEESGVRQQQHLNLKRTELQDQAQQMPTMVREQVERRETNIDAQKAELVVEDDDYYNKYDTAEQFDRTDALERELDNESDTAEQFDRTDALERELEIMKRDQIAIQEMTQDLVRDATENSALSNNEHEVYQEFPTENYSDTKPLDSKSPTSRYQSANLQVSTVRSDASSPQFRQSKTPTEEAYAELRRSMKRNRDGYLYALLQSTRSLPMDVVREIENEVEAQLREKTDSILTSITGAPLSPRRSSHVHSEACERIPGACLFRQYENDFRAILMECHENGGMNDGLRGALDGLTRQILQSPGLRQEIEPLVALLVTYATAKSELR